MSLPYAVLLQQPPDCPQADLVLIGKLPTWRAGHERRDKRLCVVFAQPVAGPRLPKAGSDCPNTNCYTVGIGHRFGELPGCLAQVMEQVSAVQVALEEVDWSGAVRDICGQPFLIFMGQRKATPIEGWLLRIWLSGSA